MTVVNPLTSPGFIDRFTVTAQAYNIPLLIVFNKVEIYDKKAIEKLEIFENSLFLERRKDIILSI